MISRAQDETLAENDFDLIFVECITMLKLSVSEVNQLMTKQMHLRSQSNSRLSMGTRSVSRGRSSSRLRTSSRNRKQVPSRGRSASAGQRQLRSRSRSKSVGRICGIEFWVCFRELVDLLQYEKRVRS